MTTGTKDRLVLNAETAQDLMTPNPVSVEGNATLQEALILFTQKGFSAAPVIDESGRPIGVLSQSDIIVHERERVNYVSEVPEYFSRSHLMTKEGERLRDFQVEKVDNTLVRDMMTPAVFSVSTETPSSGVITQMLALHVHRLFVVDPDNVLVGVITALDILRHMEPQN